MGLRGMIQKTTSIRGERAERKRRRTRGQDEGPSPPKRPAWLSQQAAAVWTASLRDLLAAGMVIQKADAEALATYCDLTAQARELSALAASEANPTAKLKYLRLAKALRKDSLLFSDRLGLTPSSRARLGVHPPKALTRNRWSDFRREIENPYAGM